MRHSKVSLGLLYGLSRSPKFMTARRFLTRNITRIRSGEPERQSDFLALEEPLEIQVAGGSGAERDWKTVAITMRTPGHDRELATGFLFGEALFRSLDQIETVYSCGARHEEQVWQNRVRVALTAGTPFDPSRYQRHFYTSSSCGVCGKTSMEALGLNHFPPIADAGWRIDEELIRSLPERLRQAQEVFDKTGGLHAAGIFTQNGQVLQVREDVGRHNAVDKVIGAQFLAGDTGLSRSILVVSGRASFELVQKAIAAGIPILVAVGAPSSLAVELAEQFGMTLIGFTKPNGFNLYTGVQRIRVEAPAFAAAVT